jgi:hypothetical protein
MRRRKKVEEALRAWQIPPLSWRSRAKQTKPITISLKTATRSTRLQLREHSKQLLPSEGKRRKRADEGGEADAADV